MYKLCVALSMLLLLSCSSRPNLAPVVELKWQQQNVHQTTHRVQRGETLYAIAFRYDKDYRQLALANHLQRPYALRVGQVLTLHANGPKRFIATRSSDRVRTALPKLILPLRTNPILIKGSTWQWPVKGRIVANFIPQQGKKGIDIAGKKGDIIHAASSGVVAYAGNGLAGYGNLIIIKHSDQFLTAYGNNKRNRVIEGQKVKVGQVIAEMGVVDRKFWGVHFEIRKAGKPIDPLLYLQKN